MSKITRLERMRYSILTKDLTKCFICGGIKQDIHEIYEGARRIPSMKYGCCIPVCRICHRHLHDDYNFALPYKQLCQKKFIETYPDVDFLEIFHKNYI